MKEISCRECGEIFNPDTEPMMCPHEEFPKKCKKHNRFHCGNSECQNQNEITLLSNRREEIAS